MWLICGDLLDCIMRVVEPLAYSPKDGHIHVLQCAMAKSVWEAEVCKHVGASTDWSVLCGPVDFPQTMGSGFAFSHSTRQAHIVCNLGMTQIRGFSSNCCKMTSVLLDSLELCNAL